MQNRPRAGFVSQNLICDGDFPALFWASMFSHSPLFWCNQICICGGVFSQLCFGSQHSLSFSSVLVRPDFAFVVVFLIF
ncbi:hypothetical protein JHK82_026807 [Glycine max]|uniref:Uncharacterized protein n=1 Tax=Glycine max TaxID=3847 RepID=K7LH70_SOYBN|nr:hypothetical protein JHK87_026686 [Glycine soja]KAG4995993.1 hypothetical protein JHK85_027432 [Glycine max]KAG5002792.1 hypothetical protein JHK86_026931 [Glycine max]KAG5125972.1 hypothetical protein JHK82_026807 [Glycine max]KAG5150565.1 hypothetical protein JHK84_027037 [Glycine max]